ncbi:MAG: HD domain-containing protein [Phycisphaeraceae bacterium]|nr:HD domain-containing protein [Phycisphaeraceae bacterium]
MERIRITSISPGTCVKQTIFSATGQKLLNAGVTVTQRHIDAIVRASGAIVYMAESLADLQESGVLESGPAAGAAASSSASSESETAAASAATTTASSTPPRPNRRALVVNQAMADALVADLHQRMRRMDLRIKSSSRHAKGNQGEALDPARLERLRKESVDHIRGIFACLETGTEIAHDELDVIVTNLLKCLDDCPTQFTQLALFDHPIDDYMSDHAFKGAVLAMAVAAQMNWSEENVRLAGVCGLVYDVGMLLVSNRIRTGAGQLTDTDRQLVRRHPSLGVALLQLIRPLDSLVQLATLQHHERENGTGYPQGLSGSAICDLARVLGVVDTFGAATEKRRYRESKLPYTAMEEMLQGTSRQSFWPAAARALVQAAGLFPVGSFVELSDGRAARVVSANPRQLDRPIVEPMAGSSACLIDLAQLEKKQLSVLKPIPKPRASFRAA